MLMVQHTGVALAHEARGPNSALACAHHLPYGGNSDATVQVMLVPPSLVGPAVQAAAAAMQEESVSGLCMHGFGCCMVARLFAFSITVMR